MSPVLAEMASNRTVLSGVLTTLGLIADVVADRLPSGDGSFTYLATAEL
jgi:hypothetical protein